MRNNFLITVILLFSISACSGIGEKRSDKSDEFLIEKKNPLVMPPDINDLPKPKESSKDKMNQNDFKETLKSSSLENQNSEIEASKTLQESIIKKIEQ